MSEKLLCTSCEASWHFSGGVATPCWNCGAEGRPLYTFDNKTIMAMAASGGCTWSANDLPGPADAVILPASSPRGTDE